ncbi:hypothetical protein HU200_032644 [Digitaria exilis]|uniref:Uncharacterized protein n=1 Tax=Digitaria exilis TaxID=1010633 RepID=A0A835BKN1_9POAL|nr:hypothetical protein HU200_032644 [Digitaria exilis]
MTTPTYPCHMRASRLELIGRIDLPWKEPSPLPQPQGMDLLPIAVITGGNKGIGFEVCRQLAGGEVTVILTARDEARGTAAVKKLRELGLSRVNNAATRGCELVDDPSFGPNPTMEKFSGMDGHQRVEWMLRNSQQSFDAAKEAVQTNYYGTKQVTEALLPLLLSSSDGRIINVTSGFGLLRQLKQELNDIDRLTEERLDELLDAFLEDFAAGEVEAGVWPTEFSAYKVAKAAMNAYSRLLARRHPALRVNCVDPGYVRTDMTGHSGLQTPEEGGARVVAVALLPAGGPTGAFFDAAGEASPSFVLTMSVVVGRSVLRGVLEFIDPILVARARGARSWRALSPLPRTLGIGLEVCRQLAVNGGVTVVLTARDEARGAAAVEELTELGLSGVLFHQLDITDASSIARLAGFLKARFGKLDILLSAMDMDQRLGWLWVNSRETYGTAKKGLRTNYYGTKQVIEAFLPLLQASSDGRIVNVSSHFGQLRRELNDIDNLTKERLDELLDMFLKDFEADKVDSRGWPKYFSAYKVAKASMNAYSRILAREHPELRVNCVHPGYVRTDMTIHSGLLTPEEGASRVVTGALLPEGGVTGAFFEDFKESTIAVVTGGNKGIGLEVCRQLASAGITVVLTARDETRGAAAVEKIREAGLSDIIFHQLEITDAPSIARLAEFLKARFGKLDILRLEWLEKGVRETYDAAKEGVKTNYYGTEHVIEALLPLLQASSDGRIPPVTYSCASCPQQPFNQLDQKPEISLPEPGNASPRGPHVWRPPREFQMTIPPFSDPASTAKPLPTRDRVPARTERLAGVDPARSPAARSSDDHN